MLMVRTESVKVYNVYKEDKPEAKTASQNIETFERFVNTHKKRIYSIAYQILGNREDAIDVSQEVFIKVYKSLGRYDLSENACFWLYRMTVNASIDYRRKNARFQHNSIDNETEVAQEEFIFSAPNPCDIVEKEEFRRIIRSLVDKLPESQRIVLTLRDLEGFSSEEVAKILKCSQTTVRWHLHKGRRKLKEMIIKEYPELIPVRKT
jgi:RNA polymerase sigma-70 factor (ECF subfamily)